MQSLVTFQPLFFPSHRLKGEIFVPVAPGAESGASQVSPELPALADLKASHGRSSSSCAQLTKSVLNSLNLLRFSVPGTGQGPPGWTDDIEVTNAAWETTQNRAMLLKLEEKGQIWGVYVMGKPTAVGSAGGAQVLAVELDGPAGGFGGGFLLAEAAGHVTGQFAKDKRLLEKNPASQSLSLSPTQVTHRSQFCLDFFYGSGKLPTPPFRWTNTFSKGLGEDSNRK